MYELFIANKNYSSWSLRPWVLLRQLRIPFQERVMPFGEGSNWHTFRAFSPSGQVPCLIDGQQIVWETPAIAEYLAERHAGAAIWPADPAARSWARSAASEMHAGFGALRRHCGMTCGQRIRLHDAGRAAIEHDLARLVELWSEGLHRFGGPFLAGASFGAVDAFFCPVAFRVQSYGLDLPEPAAGYVERLLALPAMQEWYREALAEPWRDPAHEADVLAAGSVLQDLRAG